MTPNRTSREDQSQDVGRVAGATGHAALPPAETMDLRHYAAVLVDYWWILLLCLLAGAAVGAWLWIQQADSPVFSARCRFEVTADTQLTGDPRAGNVRGGLVADEMERMTILLRSPSLQQQVRADLSSDWENQVRPELRQARVSVDVVRGSNSMLDVTVTAGHGEYALAFLEQLLREYDEYHRNWVKNRQDRASSSLEDECDRLQIRLDEARSQLLTFQEQANIRLTQAKASYDDQFLAGLVQRENAVRMERTMLESQFDVLEEANAATIKDLLDLNMETRRVALGDMEENPEAKGENLDMGATVLENQGGWQSREEELAHLEAEYQSFLEIYKPGHPKMVDLVRRIERTKRALDTSASIALKRLKSRYDALKIQEASFREAASAWKSQSQLTSGQVAQYEELRATVDHLKTRYEQAYGRMLDARAAHGDAVYRNVIDPPAFAGRNMQAAHQGLIVAIVLSLAAGAGIAFLLDYLDTSLQDIQAVEQRLGLTYLHGIPDWRKLLRRFNRKKDVVVVNQHARNPATEAYRNLRGILEHAMGEEGSYALVVTSSQPGDGKSMTATNLALTFAWTGKKVLIVDGDLRRGILDKSLGLTGKKGLTDILGDEVAKWTDAVHATEYENLDAMPAGGFRRDAPELLRPDTLRSLLRNMRATYDVIVVDTPPIGKVVEADLFSRLCDGTLLITRFGKTRYSDVQHAVRHLNGANVLGFCVNAVEFGKQRYASSYASDYYSPKAYEREGRDSDTKPPEPAAQHSTAN